MPCEDHTAAGFFPWLDLTRLHPAVVYVGATLADRVGVAVLAAATGQEHPFPGGNWTFVYGDWFLPAFLSAGCGVLRAAPNEGFWFQRKVFHCLSLTLAAAALVAIEVRNSALGFVTLQEQVLPPQVLHSVLF